MERSFGKGWGFFAGVVKRDGEEKERKKHKSYVATSRVFFPLRNFIVKKKIIEMKSKVSFYF